jgi:hypothetical protein
MLTGTYVIFPAMTATFQDMLTAESAPGKPASHMAALTIERIYLPFFLNIIMGVLPYPDKLYALIHHIFFFYSKGPGSFRHMLTSHR